MVVHRDRLVVLSFMTATNNSLNHRQQTTLPALLTPEEVVGNSSLLPDGTRPTAMAFTHTVVKTLREYIGHEQHDNLQTNIETGWGSTVSVEFLNFAFSLLVYAVRYPAIFWATNKCLGLVFSVQLLMNGMQILLAYAGMSVLYKVQIFGAWKALPLLKHQPGGLSPLGGITPFLLNPQVTLALYILSLLLIFSSSLVLYLYGHTRFLSFVNQERERKVIMLREGAHSRMGYFTHCAALCVLISVCLCNGPLFHDYTIVYKGSLDGAILATIIGSILHLFLWVVVWLFLTIKQKWTFKLRVTVGRATVRQARSLRLVTDVDLMSNNSEDPSTQPLLVVGNGRTYTITEVSPKKAIMGVIQKASMIKKVKAENSGSTADETDEEQIYWLRPALVTPHASPDGTKQLCWFNKKPKHKVTFNESSSTSIARNKSNGSRRRLPGMEIDDGDYATLRELPLKPGESMDNDNISEEGKGSSSGLTPRCLRRADSGMPHEELTPRSDSISTESSSPPDPPGSNHSETSSGIHSNESSDHQQFGPATTPPPSSSSVSTRRATSVADLQQPAKEEIQWKSCSLQRNMQPPPTSAASFAQYMAASAAAAATAASSPSSNCSSSLYGYTTSAATASSCNNYVNASDLDRNVILENPNDETVVIRRKAVRPKTTVEHHNHHLPIHQVIIKEEPFGRATNMRMTSFTDDLRGSQASSATLPHYPTQPVPSTNGFPHCSTMPLPQHTSSSIPAGHGLGGGNSCNVYPRQHTTIPTHHNGVRLFGGSQNPYLKRLQCQNGVANRYNSLNEPIYTGVNKLTGEIYHYNS
ncbi:PREDICTED: protein tincar-like isoform X2 [Nicrophorus vespilloides]|uniref:Protein tincar-like isoform X2 n=1 Tax=Nicrophorus vespilloides TaxID=110193 RepID=A0ABM1MU04_NICVS|nr:PREDICTED: protein tincar-like isoform X2 [Nicrophorus vespilloides]